MKTTTSTVRQKRRSFDTNVEWEKTGKIGAFSKISCLDGLMGGGWANLRAMGWILLPFYPQRENSKSLSRAGRREEKGEERKRGGGEEGRKPPCPPEFPLSSPTNAIKFLTRRA
jgi:hypothetical protein